MKLQLIVLALLISPAQAAKYDTATCDTIAYIFDACSVSVKQPQCFMVHRTGAGESKDLITFTDAHPELDLGPLCDQVCHGKISVTKATQRFCPGYRFKP
ncbi:hypothetical protein [Bradyrhizobium arachidis]|uniref:hypothetical protein n=1 Tax=Bradyrhizobium arachidis TaxID=858423 RepID=UPI0021621E3E|nr:hypothetical protein [Bradyrhizobium arachidis]UVO28135.1 hypothetical protein KUF59_37630 [Bradyrhizobium arachidis]